MKFEVRYPTGASHEVELPGSIAVIGRDPSCDLVLNNGKCSRRHAVVEAGPDGLVVRDSGSANGVYVNGKKTERATLAEGDEIRLGEVVVKVLATEAQGTLVMGPDELPEAPPVPAPPSPRSGDIPTVPPRFLVEPGSPARQPEPPVALPRSAPAALPAVAKPTAAPRPASAPARPPARPSAPPPAAPRAAAVPSAAEPLPRPLTGMLLAALWLLSALGYLVLAAASAWLLRGSGASPLVSIVVSVLMAMVAALVGVGLWLRASWARFLQIATAGIGLLTCVFTPLSVAALAYMLRAASQIHFSGRSSYRELTDEEVTIVRADSGEGMFMAGVLVAALLTLVLAVVAIVLGIPALATKRP